MVLLVLPVSFGSSTIYDGIIVTVKSSPPGKKSKEKGPSVTLGLRSMCSPYSSESIHPAIMTHKSRRFKLNYRNIRDFKVISS